MWLTKAQLIGAMDCRVLVDPAGREAVVESLVWDSREVRPGCAFVAIRGEHVDGNDFAGRAIADGAAFVIASRGLSPTVLDAARAADAGVVVVDDPICALQQLAAYARDHFAGTVVGVTGSSGKTTTKNMIATVLSAEFPTTATDANHNNELGVAATVLQAGRDTRMLVVEMGMRGRGQLQALCGFVRPHIGLVTNIGTAHAELLGSRDNIARAKAELVAALPEGTGIAVLNGDDPFTPAVREFAHTDERGVRVLLYGTGDACDVRGFNVAFDDRGLPAFDVEFPDGRTASVRLPLAGMHNVMNALGAAAVGYACDMPIERIANALRTVRPQAMRQETFATAVGVTVVNDAYNANPDSMASALATVKMMSGHARRCAVLGDMGELGDSEVEAHRQVGQLAADAGLDLLVTVGTRARHIAEAARAAGMADDAVVPCQTADDALVVLHGWLAAGDLVLVKASRFMQLEHVVAGIAGMGAGSAAGAADAAAGAAADTAAAGAMQGGA